MSAIRTLAYAPPAPFAAAHATAAHRVPPTVCAIDPGPTQSAVIRWNGESIGYREQLPNAEVRAYIRSYIGVYLVIEQIASFGMPVGFETFQTCYESGRFIECAHESGLPCFLMKRLQVKQHICHDTRAKDGNIAAALVDRFGNRELHGTHAKGTKKAPGFFHGFASHDWAAFALAVTAWDLRPWENKSQ